MREAGASYVKGIRTSDICSRITVGDLLTGGGKLSELRKIIHRGWVKTENCCCGYQNIV